MSEDFKYLGNNPGTQNVPFLDNVDVQKTVTNFNYSLWGASTKLYLKHVPASWSSDYKNVVQFESKEERDAYFKTNPPITLETEFRIGHDGTIRLPIPYDNLINYNYLVAEYPNAPVPNYQSNIARKQYFYFIKDCKYIAPNTTEVVLDLDIWTTYLDDIEIANMQLERGHYPMTLTDVDSYLANPLLNRIGLDTMDVSFGNLCKIPTDHQFNIYGEVFYLVATTSDPTIFTKNTTTYNAGDKWHKGLFYFSVAESNWTTWVNNTMNSTPAFFQTIRGILVMPRTLFSEGSTYFEFNGVNCYIGLESVFSIDYTFTKEDFGYKNKYKWITKLYTSPYAMVELLDFNGSKQQIPFEDLYVGKFAMQLFCNLAIANPTARIVLMNIGGNGNNGEFNQTAIDINIPSMSVNLSPSKKYLFETEYPRIQQQNDINLSYNNGVRSNDTGKTNSDASAATGKTNADASADLTSKITKRANDQTKKFSLEDINTNKHTVFNTLVENYHNWLMQNQYSVTQRDIQYGMGKVNEELANVGIGLNIVNQSISLGAGLATGGIAGAMGATASAGNAASSIASMTGGGIVSLIGNVPAVSREVLWDDDHGYEQSAQGKTGLNTKSIDAGIKLNAFIFRNSWGSIWEGGVLSGDPSITYHEPNSNSRMGLDSNNKTNHTNENFNNAESNRTDTLNLSKANNKRSYDQTIANNKRSYDTTAANLLASKGNSEAAIQNAINQSYLNDNATYGATGDHSKWANGLMALHYHIKTQSDDAIARAGDYFLRYGYAYNGNCQFTNFNIMRYYTFWKCQEVWLSSDRINSNVIDKFKNILETGVTVWRNPADMGNVSIYDNTILQGGE